MCLVVSLRKSGEQTLKVALDAPEGSWCRPRVRWRTMSPDWCLMRWMLKQLPWPRRLITCPSYRTLTCTCSYLAGVCVSVKCIYNIHQMFCLGNSVNQTASWYGLFDINMLGLYNNSSILSPERKRQNKVTGWDPMVEIRNMEHLIYGFVTVKNTSFLLKSYCHPLLGLGFWQLKGHLASGYAKCHIVTAPLC